jgi:hypothetical protein
MGLQNGVIINQRYFKSQVFLFRDLSLMDSDPGMKASASFFRLNPFSSGVNDGVEQLSPPAIHPKEENHHDGHHQPCNEINPFQLDSFSY